MICATATQHTYCTPFDGLYSWLSSLSEEKTRKKRQLALQCHLRLPVSPVVLAFNHEAGSEIISVSNFNTIGQCTAESLAIQRMFSARILTLYTQS